MDINKYWDFIDKKMKEKMEKDEEYQQLKNLKSEYHSLNKQAQVIIKYEFEDYFERPSHDSKRFKIHNIEEAKAYLEEAKDLIPMLKSNRKYTFWSEKLKNSYKKKLTFALDKQAFCQRNVDKLENREALILKMNEVKKAFKDNGGDTKMNEIERRIAGEVVSENIDNPIIEWAFTEALVSKGNLKHYNFSYVTCFINEQAKKALVQSDYKDAMNKVKENLGKVKGNITEECISTVLRDEEPEKE